MTWTRSLLKYPGGKYSLLDVIDKALPQGDFDVYAEPFLGGASVALNIGRRYPKMLLNDANSDLIDFWKAIAKDSKNFMAWVEKYSECRGSENYQIFRNTFNKRSASISGAQRAALFYYLNREGFNGLIRYNSKGDFNVPHGKYKTFKLPSHEHLDEIASVLAGNVSLSCFSWQSFIDRVVVPLLDQKLRVLLYIDPPYVPLSKTSNFTSYWKPFGVAEHEELRKGLDALTDLGAKWILSNSKCEATERIFQDYNFFEVVAPRNISCKGNTRGAVKEYLITNFS